MNLSSVRCIEQTSSGATKQTQGQSLPFKTVEYHDVKNNSPAEVVNCKSLTCDFFNND